jgi:hypothetical protein
MWYNNSYGALLSKRNGKRLVGTVNTPHPFSNSRNMNLCTEVDTNSHLEITNANKATFTTLAANENAYLYSDYGVGFWDETYAAFRVKITASSSQYSLAGVCGFCNSVGQLYDATKHALYVVLEQNGASTYGVALFTSNGAAITYTAYVTLSINTDYWIKLIKPKNSSLAILQVYSDATFTTLVGAYGLTVEGPVSYRYFYPVSSLNNSTVYTISGYVQDIELAKLNW